jgi:hypothetical protein
MDNIQAVYMKDLVNTIFEELNELKSEEKNDLNYGKSLAYAYVLGIIKGSIAEEAQSKYGLDIDIDKIYL